MNFLGIFFESLIVRTFNSIISIFLLSSSSRSTGCVPTSRMNVLYQIIVSDHMYSHNSLSLVKIIRLFISIFNPSINHTETTNNISLCITAKDSKTWFGWDGPPMYGIYPDNVPVAFIALSTTLDVCCLKVSLLSSSIHRYLIENNK